MLAFRRSNPDVDVHTLELPMDQLPELVRGGEVDIGFVRMPMALPRELVVQPLLHDHFCLALPLSHPLALQERNPSPKQLAGESLVVPEQLAGTTEVARRGDFSPRIVASPGRMSAVLTEVSLGTGIAIVPNCVCEAMRLPGLTFRDLTGTPIPSEVAAIFRSDASAIGQLFVKQLEGASVREGCLDGVA